VFPGASKAALVKAFNPTRKGDKVSLCERDYAQMATLYRRNGRLYPRKAVVLS